MKKCPYCNRAYSNNDYYCLNDNNRLIECASDQSDTIQIKDSPNTYQIKNVPKCPTCQSTNIKKISSAKRSLHAFAFGVFNKTAQSQFECGNCGYKW